MAYKYGNRYEQMLFPLSIEEYVSKNDPVRVFDLFVEQLDLDAIGLYIERHISKAGNSEYDPKAMLKLLLYGYSYGERSSRKLERAVHHNFSFIWLVEGLKPSYRTIARFRRKNRDVLSKLLKESAKLCIDLDLIAGNTLFVDGTKIKADASLDNHYTEEQCEKFLENIDERIAKILKECSLTDKKERKFGSLVKLRKELVGKEKLKNKIKKSLKKIKYKEKKSINIVDEDCVKTKGRQGFNAGYNLQIVTDEKNGLIVHSDVVTENNDLNQFSKQIKEANKTVGGGCQNACGDAGYFNVNELSELSEEQNIKVVVPSNNQAQEMKRKTKKSKFDKDNFIYDETNDTYKCPADKILRNLGYSKEKDRCRYKIDNRGKVCRECKFFNECTKDKTGRNIYRKTNETARKKLEASYLLNKDIYRKRQGKVEHPFGHIKRNLGVTNFFIRGLKSVKAEGSLFTTCFNLTRMIKLIGTKKLIELIMVYKRQKYFRTFCCATDRIAVA